MKNVLILNSRSCECAVASTTLLPLPYSTKATAYSRKALVLLGNVPDSTSSYHVLPPSPLISSSNNSIHDYLTIRWRFLRVIGRDAADHFRVWRLTIHLLWPRFIKCVLNRTWREGYRQSIKRIIEQTFQRSIWRLTTLPNGVSELDVPTATKKRKLNPDTCQSDQ